MLTLTTFLRSFKFQESILKYPVMIILLQKFNEKH